MPCWDLGKVESQMEWDLTHHWRVRRWGKPAERGSGVTRLGKNVHK